MKIIKIIVGVFAVCCLPILASANAEVEKKLIERISQSQAELQICKKRLLRKVQPTPMLWIGSNKH